MRSLISLCLVSVALAVAATAPPVTQGKFVGKPIAVTALQFTGYNQNDIYQAFINFGVPPPFSWASLPSEFAQPFETEAQTSFGETVSLSWGPDDYDRLFVRNPKGIQSADKGDWIIKINGYDYYFVLSDVNFRALYQPMP